MTGQTLLIVEDDPGLQSQLRWNFDQYKVQVADDRESAIAAIRKSVPAVVTLDLGLPPDPGGVSEGFRTLQEILAETPFSKVIVITGNNDTHNAVKSIGLGAYDFYQKPIEPEILSLVVKRAFRVFELEEENRSLARQHFAYPLRGIIAASTEMHEVCRTIERLAPTDVTTLILGESGTGKEVLAHALHALSPRANGPFVAVNCAAIPENLLESELFGHEKGAFTGADKQVKGKFELAEGGTFFLDEIGDIPLALQPKLLRFLQERVIERIGGRKEISVDVRVVCATHQDIQKLIEQGRFREDLYYRINAMVVSIPAVRERSGDIQVLAKAFLARYVEQMKSKLTGFSETAIAAMECYSWPGNVRELESRVKRAVIMSNGPLIDAEDLMLPGGKPSEKITSLREIRDSAERQAICQALSECNGNVSKAAELLEITRPTLYSLLTKYRLKI
ncbi:MAG: PEP-CTERM-box response regulator transcription factor [Methylococcaceae bacterium]|nr:PEP-CTERM-box response regulator transcription factor [Methylococcaceae bacterium]MCI0732269.1 PEP-CTERM-box response regulator transcription factor [Methylococcaceae bacterium]